MFLAIARRRRGRANRVRVGRPGACVKPAAFEHRGTWRRHPGHANRMRAARPATCCLPATPARDAGLRRARLSVALTAGHANRVRAVRPGTCAKPVCSRHHRDVPPNTATARAAMARVSTSLDAAVGQSK